MFDENKKAYAVSLVDPEYPNIDTEEFIRDILLLDGKIIITEKEFDDRAIEEDHECFVTPYTKYKVLTINDLKEAITKKKVVIEYDGEESLIISDLSDEDSFMSFFGEEYLDDMVHRGLVYFVKGKTKKMKIGKFVKDFVE